MKTKNILTGALLALTTIGCTDLDVDIKSQYTEMPDSEIAIDAQMSNAFYWTSTGGTQSESHGAYRIGFHDKVDAGKHNYYGASALRTGNNLTGLPVRSVLTVFK